MHPWMQKEQTVYPNRIPPDGLTIPFVKKALSLSIPQCTRNYREGRIRRPPGGLAGAAAAMALSVPPVT